MNNNSEPGTFVNCKNMPHNGKLLADFIRKNKLNRAELARIMQVSSTSVYQYAASTSLQMSILWKASLATKHNFVADLAEALPVDYTSGKISTLETRIKELESELEKKEIEISVYKNIVGK